MNQFVQWPASHPQDSSQKPHHIFEQQFNLQRDLSDTRKPLGYMEPNYYGGGEGLGNPTGRVSNISGQEVGPSQTRSHFFHQQPSQQQHQQYQQQQQQHQQQQQQQYQQQQQQQQQASQFFVQQQRELHQNRQDYHSTNMNEQSQFGIYKPLGPQGSQAHHLNQTYSPQPVNSSSFQSGNEMGYVVANTGFPYSAESRQMAAQGYTTMTKPLMPYPMRDSSVKDRPNMELSVADHPVMDQSVIGRPVTDVSVMGRPVPSHSVINHPAMDQRLGSFSQANNSQVITNSNLGNSGQYLNARKMEPPNFGPPNAKPAVFSQPEPARHPVPSTFETQAPLSHGQDQQTMQNHHGQLNDYQIRYQKSLHNDNEREQRMDSVLDRPTQPYGPSIGPYGAPGNPQLPSGTQNVSQFRSRESAVYSTNNSGSYAPRDIQATRYPAQGSQPSENRQSADQYGTRLSSFPPDGPHHFQPPADALQRQLRHNAPFGFSSQSREAQLQTSVNDTRYQGATSAHYPLPTAGRPTFVNPARETVLAYAQAPVSYQNSNYPTSSAQTSSPNVSAMQQFQGPGDYRPAYPQLSREPSSQPYPHNDVNTSTLHHRSPDIVNRLNSMTIQKTPTSFNTQPHFVTGSDSRPISRPRNGEDIFNRPPSLFNEQNGSYKGAPGTVPQPPSNFTAPYPEQRLRYPVDGGNFMSQRFDPHSRVQNQPEVQPGVHANPRLSNQSLMGPGNPNGPIAQTPRPELQPPSGLYLGSNIPRPTGHDNHASVIQTRPVFLHQDTLIRQPNFAHDNGRIQQQSGAASQPIVIMPGYSSTVATARTPTAKFEPRIETILEHISAKQGPAYDKLKRVLVDIFNIQDDVFSFRGRRGDRNYIMIEEMLTRQLLILDGIESQDSEDLRLSRRSIIRQVQGLISTLESKART